MAPDRVTRRPPRRSSKQTGGMLLPPTVHHLLLPLRCRSVGYPVVAVLLSAVSDALAAMADEKGRGAAGRTR